jgi:hypothetical protein
MTPARLVLWLTGLPCSGKSTVAALVTDALGGHGLTVRLLVTDAGLDETALLGVVHAPVGGDAAGVVDDELAARLRVVVGEEQPRQPRAVRRDGEAGRVAVVEDRRRAALERVEPAGRVVADPRSDQHRRHV